MKNALFLKAICACLLTVFLLNGVSAQKSVNAIFRQYKHSGDEHIHFIVPGAIFKIGSLFGRDRAERRLIRSVHSMRILVIEGGSPVTSGEMQHMIRRAENAGVEPLIEVRDGSDTQFAIAAKEKRGKIRRLLVTFRDGDEFVLIRMKGRIRIEDVNQLIQKAGKKSEKQLPKLPLPLPKKAEGPQV